MRPTARAWELLKRVGRYLKGRPRLIWKYAWQAPVSVLDTHSDANWAGCRISRKSSSGGTFAIGGHLIKTYAKTQATVAKSSGESELYWVVRASTDGLGILTLLADFGNELSGQRRNGRKRGDWDSPKERTGQAETCRSRRTLAAGTASPPVVAHQEGARYCEPG